MTPAFWAVTACPRPGLPRGYLPGFLMAWHAEMAARASMNLFFDTGCELGAAENFRRVLVAGVKSRAPLIHAFQDDARPCVGAFSRVAALKPPRWASLATWQAHVRGVPRLEPGWNRLPIGDFCGFVALTIRRRTAIEMLAYLKKHPWGHRHLADEIPRACYKGAVRFVAQHVPDLFDHVGAVSAAHPGAEVKGARASGSFAEDFDARTLGAFK